MKPLSKTPHLRSYVSTLRSIPGGKYRIGASPANKNSGTQVTMSSFRMGATPVTWGMWKEFCQSFGDAGRGIKLLDDPGWGYPDNHPVVNISWNDIMNCGLNNIS